MKIYTVPVCLIIIFLFLSEFGTCFAQTMATGHITAEVIESISASSQSVASLALATESTTNNFVQNQQTLTTSTVNTGAIMLNTGNTFTVNVVLKSEIITGNPQICADTETSPTDSATLTNPKSDNLQSGPISGTPNVADTLSSEKYHGTYTVVFACN